ncbi:hypothetical protein FBD94_08315 [Pedobacter hiemivivus]|uniref:Uncharacterized protein n=1 Tax=Pedobacter hiemivivus TaxID=2530454 RepID=A0A4V5PCW4_9SPHI|nr:hypothetical protein [Pedobacter hiemivivus]TKC62216.1 hypothetical protein FBD94_08315 [Pedobacter hiemivivus]
MKELLETLQRMEGRLTRIDERLDLIEERLDHLDARGDDFLFKLTEISCNIIAIFLKLKKISATTPYEGEYQNLKIIVS